jgi:hypothetical protein
MASPPPIREIPAREKMDKNYHVEMPRIPGVERRPSPLAQSRPAAAPNDVREETAQQAEGIYAGPVTKPDIAAAFKRVAKIGALIVLAAMLGSWAIKRIGRVESPDSELPAHSQDSAPSSQPQTTETNSAARPLYATPSNPQVATVNELARPWSSKKFFFRNLAQSKYVPALVVRLPGPASDSGSYWAFSLEAPFTQCQFAYIDDLAKLSSEYRFEAAHPMVVNPCSRAIHDPLQHTELTGNVLVRGALVQGHDLRPPYGIELNVRGNQVRAVAME